MKANTGEQIIIPLPSRSTLFSFAAVLAISFKSITIEQLPVHVPGKDRRSKPSQQEDDDGGFEEHRVSSLGSTPDIPAAVSGSGGRAPPVGRTSFTYCSPAELSHSLSNRLVGE